MVRERPRRLAVSCGGRSAAVFNYEQAAEEIQLCRDAGRSGDDSACVGVFLCSFPNEGRAHHEGRQEACKRFGDTSEPIGEQNQAKQRCLSIIAAE